MAVNKVILVGNLGKDPELRSTKTSREMCVFSLATEDVRKDKDGQYQTTTDWHQIVTFGSTAKSCAKFLSKGSSVYLEGRLKPRSWEDKDGKKRYAVDIIPSIVKFMDKKFDGKGTNQSQIETSAMDSDFEDGDIPW